MGTPVGSVLSLRRRDIESAIELLYQSSVLEDERKQRLLDKLCHLRDSLCDSQAACERCPEECACAKVIAEVFGAVATPFDKP